MGAVTVSVQHNALAKTITYTFSAKAQFELVAAPNTEVPLLDIPLAMFTVHKVDFDSDWDEPIEGNETDDIVLTSVTGTSAGTSLVFTYTGECDGYSAAAAYNIYALGYILETEGDDTDSSANHIQAVFHGVQEVPILTMTARNVGTALTTTKAVAFTNGGMVLTKTRADERCVLVLVNTDGSNAEAYTIYKGDGINAVYDISGSLAAGNTHFIVLESAAFKFVDDRSHDMFGKTYMRAGEDVKVYCLEII